MFRAFFRRHGEGIFFTVLSLFLFALIFFLFDLSWSLFTIPAASLVVTLVIYLLIAGLNDKQEKNLEEDKRRLQEEIKQMEAQEREGMADLEEYFLMWVHQIKTPITASYLLLEEDPVPSRQLKDELVKIENYSNLAMNYIKLTHPDRDMNLSRVRLDDLLTPLIKKYRFQFISYKNSLDYQTIDTEVITDAQLCQILLEQVLNNALKYTEGGLITISFDSDLGQLTIKDTGIGIPSQDLKKIFYRGYSGLNGRVNEKSSGIGLYLVDMISQRLNHPVKIDSSLGQGTSVMITFNLTNLSA